MHLLYYVVCIYLPIYIPTYIPTYLHILNFNQQHIRIANMSYRYTYTWLHVIPSFSIMLSVCYQVDIDRTYMWSKCSKLLEIANLLIYAKEIR